MTRHSGPTEHGTAPTTAITSHRRCSDQLHRTPDGTPNRPTRSRPPAAAAHWSTAAGGGTSGRVHSAGRVSGDHVLVVAPDQADRSARRAHPRYSMSAPRGLRRPAHVRQPGPGHRERLSPLAWPARPRPSAHVVLWRRDGCGRPATCSRPLQSVRRGQCRQPGAPVPVGPSAEASQAEKEGTMVTRSHPVPSRPRAQPSACRTSPPIAHPCTSRPGRGGAAGRGRFLISAAPRSPSGGSFFSPDLREASFSLIILRSGRRSCCDLRFP